MKKFIKNDIKLRHEFIKATLYRVLLFTSLFWSFLLLLVTMCGWVSYHVQTYEEDELQVNIWSTCTLGRDPGAYDCVNGWMDNYLDNNAPGWFHAFRSLFVMSLILQFLSVLYPIVMFAFTENKTNRNVWLVALLVFVAGSFLLIVQILYHLYNQFDFLTNLHYVGLGWTEETPYEDMVADGYYCTWASFGFCYLNTILSLLMWRYEIEFSKLDFSKM